MHPYSTPSPTVAHPLDRLVRGFCCAALSGTAPAEIPAKSQDLGGRLKSRITIEAGSTPRKRKNADSGSAPPSKSAYRPLILNDVSRLAGRKWRERRDLNPRPPA